MSFKLLFQMKFIFTRQTQRFCEQIVIKASDESCGSFDHFSMGSFAFSYLSFYKA